MIRLFPSIDIAKPCPFCSGPLNFSDWLITGMHSIGHGTCRACSKEMFLELPINAGLFYPGMIDKETGTRFDNLPFDNWYLDGLVESYNNKKNYEVEFIVNKYKSLGEKPVYILNTIDATYGHALFELFNASYYLKRDDIDLIILVQKDMSWLLPDGAAETWVVDIPFSKANDWNNWLARRIKQQVAGYNHVFLCRSFVQADSSDYDIEDYTGIKPFDLNRWDENIDTPVVTFIWRTDRFWRRVLPKWLDNRYSVKFFPRVLKQIRNHYQFKWILRFSKALKETLPNVDFAIAGMDDRKRTLPEWIKDYRYPKHADETALEQCRRYAKSHVIIGCNGSSLVLPGCHAGAVINIVPGDAWAVSAGSFPFRITSIGDTHFRYVMLPAEVSIKRLISIALSIMRDRSLIVLHTSSPWRNHEGKLDHFEWSQFRKRSFEITQYFRTSVGLVTQKRKL